MYFNSLLAFTGYVTLTQAYTIPPNLKNGVYIIKVDSFGEETHELVQGLTNNTGTGLEILDAPKLQTRDPPLGYNMHCGCGFNMDHDNCDKAVNGMKNYLDANGSKATSKGVYVVNGAAVAFICNNSAVHNSYSITSGTYADVLVRITNAWYV